MIMDREPININLGERSYPVYVAPGLLSQAGGIISNLLPQAKKCVIVTSRIICDLHCENLLSSLKESGIKAGITLVPDGEEAKTWSSAESLIGDMLEIGLDRKSTVIAFGGGTVGDLSGFVASIYMRGISLIQIPTTLLAQVDSSLGGKAAVNHPSGKNLIGSFHQPNLVLSDSEILSTLPEREMLNGLSEVVKHGVIADSTLFKYVEDNSEKILKAEPHTLCEIVLRNVSIKGKFVEKDERDLTGIRAVLNYGHTTGHALEKLTSMDLKHGEAVALGMCIASNISVKQRLMKPEDAKHQRSLLENLGFDLTPPRVDPEDVVKTMWLDKKTEADTLRFILPTGIGSTPKFIPVSEATILDALKVEGYG